MVGAGPSRQDIPPSPPLRARARSVGRRLSSRGLTISVCESCTGGLLAASITEIPGSSRYFLGGIVAYADRIKEKVVGVRRKTLNEHGAVSPEACREMARRTREIFRSDLAVAITGVAGPSGGSKKKPVGLVYVAADRGSRAEIRRCFFAGGRREIRIKSCRTALDLIDLLAGSGGAGRRKK